MTGHIEFSTLEGERIYVRTECNESGLRADGTNCGVATFAELCERGVNPRQKEFVSKQKRAYKFKRGVKLDSESINVDLNPSPVLQPPSPRWGEGKSVAFTLAEVLITLGIIGVVAALTLPSLIQNYKEKELIVRTKRLYANIQNAALLAQKENDSIGDNSALFNPSQSSAEVAKNFSKYFTGSKVCANMNAEGCSQYYYKLKYATRRKGEDGNLGGGIQNFSKIILEDGAIIGVAQSTSCDKLVTNCQTDADGNCRYDEQGNPLMYTYRNTICAYLWLDVNGVSLPNQYGRDGYVIQVYTDKMKPEQTQCWGGNSFYNILTGKDKLEYVKYNIGDNY